MIEPSHLAPGATAFISAPDHVGIRAIRADRWVGFGRARRVLHYLDALCDHPLSTRPPRLAIYGHSGMGKAKSFAGITLRSSTGILAAKQFPFLLSY
ncbi:TniB family NTP-binding protein [Methylocystis echinoides]|uniref:TniB family NTP-binding protein n=1 Tax=Methylocystis echinoides TaxID=29468 RepID=UPI00341534B5